ncbi:MAG: Gfo/Idh/MocA family oxidoreductase [Dehalococcoidia bacterium]
MADAARRIGVLGVGFGTVVHVPGFRSEGWEVAALWSRRVERAREKAAELEIPDVHDNYQDLLKRDDLDAVAVVTPPLTHHEITMAALRAGKHVLCEKPFAGNAQEADEMRALAEESGLTAMIAHEFRYAPQRAFIKQLIGDGFIGEFRLATMELLFTFPPERLALGWMSHASMGGGVLGAIGIHYIDALRHWFGEVGSVSAQIVRFAPSQTSSAAGADAPDSDDSFALVLTFQNGGIATMTISAVASPAQGARIAIVGSAGSLTASQPGPNPPPDGIVYGGKAGGESLTELPMPSKYVPLIDDRDQRLMPFRLLVRDFARGIDEGTSPAPNFVDGLRGQEILDAIRSSAESGNTISIG